VTQRAEQQHGVGAFARQVQLADVSYRGLDARVTASRLLPE